MNISIIPGLNHVINEQNIDDNSVIIDAGACKGDFIEWVRQKWKCKIIAIEPSLQLVELLKERNFENVEIIHAALVGDKEPKEVMFYENGKQELGNIYGLYPGVIRTYVVPTITLSKLELPIIDYLKMDIERAEKGVIETITPELAKTIKQMSFEYHDRGSINSLIKHLDTFGFQTSRHEHCEIYASLKAFKHKYGENFLEETNVRDYFQVWKVEWFEKNVFPSISKGDSVLDVGCGNGRLIGLFKKRFKRIVGIDAYLYEGNFYKKYDKFINEDFEFVKIDEKFDCVCFFASFYQMVNSIEALKKAVGLLKRNGRIIMVDSIRRETEKNEWWYSLKELCEKLNLKIKYQELKGELQVTLITK